MRHRRQTRALLLMVSDSAALRPPPDEGPPRLTLPPPHVGARRRTRRASLGNDPGTEADGDISCGGGGGSVHVWPAEAEQPGRTALVPIKSPLIVGLALVKAGKAVSAAFASFCVGTGGGTLLIYGQTGTSPPPVNKPLTPSTTEFRALGFWAESSANNPLNRPNPCTYEAASSASSSGRGMKVDECASLEQLPASRGTLTLISLRLDPRLQIIGVIPRSGNQVAHVANSLAQFLRFLKWMFPWCCVSRKGSPGDLSPWRGDGVRSERVESPGGPRRLVKQREEDGGGFLLSLRPPR